MKKLILIIAAIFACGMTYAQVSGAPTASQVGALPGAGAGANTGLSIQNGDDNKVQVRQAGTEQSVLTVQDNGSGLGGNLARIRQTGAVSASSGVRNDAEVNQSGTGNQSTTRQEGDYNNAITNQGQNNDASSFNKARIQQGVADQAEENYAATEQDGDNNQSSTLQTYDNSDAWTRQIGDDNKNMIVQDAGPNGTDGHEAMAWQNGEGNESAINQSGAGARNVAMVGQIGDFNQAKQLQTTDALAGGTGNTARIGQGFPGNVMGFGNMPVLLSTRLDIQNNVDPDAGSITGNVPSRYNKALQVQSGNQNEADMFQFGGTIGPSNYGEQVQSGSGNQAGLSQGHLILGGSANDDNYAKQNQEGSSNYAGLAQEGNSMKALQDQRGSNNEALSYQGGSGHLLNIHQRGDSNVAYSAQRGLSNAALIVQKDGQSYTVRQNQDLGMFDLSAGGNQADILQLGPNGDFHADAIDCDFEDPMNLDMNYDVPMFDLDPICDGC